MPSEGPGYHDIYELASDSASSFNPSKASPGISIAVVPELDTQLARIPTRNDGIEDDDEEAAFYRSLRRQEDERIRRLATRGNR